MNGLVLNMRLMEVEALQEMYVDILTKWKPTNPHEKLLYEHAREMELALRLRVAKETRMARINLNRSETMALLQLWQIVEVDGDQWKEVLVNELIKQADMHMKQPDGKLLKLANTGS